MQTKAKEGGIAGYSVKALLFTAVGVTLLTVYVAILIYGENSLSVLTQLKEKKVALQEEAKALKEKNQKLQKSYFEFKQLVPPELPDGAL